MLETTTVEMVVWRVSSRGTREKEGEYGRTSFILSKVGKAVPVRRKAKHSGFRLITYKERPLINKMDGPEDSAP